MRISTSMMHTSAVNAMLQQQADLSKAQNEISSGKKVQTPADDPVAAVRIMQLQQQQSASDQYGTNINGVQTRLQTSEQAVADADSIIQRVSQLAVQANSAALSASDKQSISSELTELNKQLLNIANTKDTNGEYLFSGYAATTQPFARSSSGSVAYSGDQATRSVQVGASQYMTDGDSGQSVFMSVPGGNGTFTLGSSASNTGSGVIAGSVQNSGAWVPDNYTLSFTSASNWQVTDSASPANVVASGAYSSGTAINFNGVAITVTGTPAAGDSFNVSKSKTQDIFSTIDALSTALNASTSTSADQAQYQNSISAIETQLSQADTHLLNVRAGIGARLSALTSIDNTRQDTSDQLKTSLSGLQDANYAESASRYSQLYVSLQAAQQSYAKIAQMSLFSYL